MSGTTVEGLSEMYLEELRHRASVHQISWGHVHGVRHKLQRITEALRPSTPLRKIGKPQLLEAVLYFAGRPAAQPRPYQPQPDDACLSVATVRGIINQLKYLFAWAADHDQLTWERPRGFDRVFKLKQYRLKTPQERLLEAQETVSGEVQTFSVPELVRLFDAATSRERLYLLLGLNCGFTSGEISSLRQFEVFLDETPHIHKRRSKTGVEARWTLWPETAALLRKHKAAPNESLHWLLTEYGKPLVAVTETHRRDSIGQAWKQLFMRTGLPCVGFRFLRKTGANAIKRIGGLEESEMYLAHQEPGLNKAYANRNWDRLWSCLEKYRAQLPFLGPAWTLEPEECLFTMDQGMPWGDIQAPFTQRVTKRNELRRLNVSLHKGKGLFYVRVYRDGTTHFDGYFQTAAEAEKAARRLRLELDGVHARAKA